MDSENYVVTFLANLRRLGKKPNNQPPPPLCLPN